MIRRATVEVFDTASIEDSWREKVPPKGYNNLSDYIACSPKRSFIIFTTRTSSPMEMNLRVP
jgi:hypothetical protein